MPDSRRKRDVTFAGGMRSIVAPVREQMERFTHTCFQVTLYDSYVELAERLNALAPISGKAKTALFTTGSQAARNAIKIDRQTWSD